MPGHKTCPQCQKQSGVRLRQCACGHIFVAKQRGSQPNPTMPNEPKGKREFIPVHGNAIVTPSGKCPVPWEGDLHQWILRIAEYGHYSPIALKYWLKRITGDDYTEIAAQLDALTKGL